MTLAGEQEICFPVRGLHKTALMSAVDSSGKNLIEYRAVRSQQGARFEYWSMDAVINPTGLKIPRIELLVAVSAGSSFSTSNTVEAGVMMKSSPTVIGIR